MQTMKLNVGALLLSVVTVGVLTLSSSQSVAQSKGYERRLDSLGIRLFAPQKPKANYVKAVRVGNLIFLAGHGSAKENGDIVAGRVGGDLTLEQGMDAARTSTISLLSTLKAEIGTLNNVKRIVHVTGWVNSTADFREHSKVMNGCSDLLIAVFGENGLHARSSVGASSLPNNFVTEIEMIVEVK
ncbi:hypothetical protein WSM22_38870 [Cytophagales bacterium WSM2-2]|nr:hypothetical protein WSM22_38870 [Cytophagales bacterium WSM2-2]